MDIIGVWLEQLSILMSNNLWLGLVIALLAGLLTSFTPCSLSSIPLVIGFVGGYTEDKKKAFYYSVIFCVGMTIAFTIIGIIAALVGRLFFGMIMYWYLILGVLMVLMALQTWEIIDILPKKCGYSSNSKKGTVGALSLGAVGAFISSPCSTPVLIAIIAVVSTGQSILMGALMLLLYSLGHSILLVVAGTSIGWVSELNKSEKFKKSGKIIKKIMGALIMLLAVYLIFSAFR